MAGFNNIAGPTQQRIYLNDTKISLAGSTIAWTDVAGTNKVIEDDHLMATVTDITGGDTTPNIITVNPIGTSAPVQFTAAPGRNNFTLTIIRDGSKTHSEAIAALEVGDEIAVAMVLYNSATAQTAKCFNCTVASTSLVFSGSAGAVQNMSLAVVTEYDEVAQS